MQPRPGVFTCAASNNHSIFSDPSLFIDMPYRKPTAPTVARQPPGVRIAKLKPEIVSPNRWNRFSPSPRSDMEPVNPKKLVTLYLPLGEQLGRSQAYPKANGNRKWGHLEVSGTCRVSDPIRPTLSPSQSHAIQGYKRRKLRLKNLRPGPPDRWWGHCTGCVRGVAM
jgi:hypothetical protein